ncbi:RNA polymerase sigma factor [Enterococcus faecalis]|uniref:RNA polymerase sigma factor n=1 Tax=Enterococcus faecalis TaxID=1351 RepID=UPI0021E0CF31|nr:sigma-70 family RNA polymerase sigma factor [Enterococcus faecalis]MCU9758206.1 sigma-70 family RNA polymerase sigma factor [Enterococcus faecalis]MCU9772527.1 sigma-70 family RNA polymerase sigma factor [Enterococcus faecalis]MCU9772804.1 sigma-70 family RNA polymerase sigma factor [Enterococcus faecalis]MCU9792160.1 sigma-70 family RNA polymerase sigma factor [Enterococcus faecalis]HEC4826983.1 sigma-70 family RNA polymerase sigma factor [Enterococcus faecalis]
MDYSQEAHIQHLFDSYCKKVLCNEAKDIRDSRSAQRENQIDLDLVHDHGKDSFLNYNVEEEIVLSISYGLPVLRSDLEKALIDLDKLSRKIICLYYFDYYNDREIGEILGIKKGTVNYSRKRSIRKIKASLSRGVYDEK